MLLVVRQADSLKALSLIHGKLLVYVDQRFGKPFLAWLVGRDRPSTSLHWPTFRDWADVLDPYKYKIRFLHLYCYPPMKWWTKQWLSYLKLAIALEGTLLNQTLAVPFKVVRNALHMTSSGVIWRCISVLYNLMWSKGSFKPMNDSSCGRQNFGGKGRFNTLAVKGEWVLLIIPSRFLVRPFPASYRKVHLWLWLNFLLLKFLAFCYLLN